MTTHCNIIYQVNVIYFKNIKQNTLIMKILIKIMNGHSYSYIGWNTTNETSVNISEIS